MTGLLGSMWQIRSKKRRNGVGIEQRNPSTMRVTSFRGNTYHRWREESVAAYNIHGYNYFRLYDLMILLDVGVIYDDMDGTVTAGTSIVNIRSNEINNLHFKKNKLSGE